MSFWNSKSGVLYGDFDADTGYSIILNSKSGILYGEFDADRGYSIAFS
jgi:hypothetical protein